MENVFGGGAIGLYLFLYVLPGIFGAFVYDYVLEGEKRETVDRVLSALVLALVGYLSLYVLTGARLVPNVEIKSDTPPNVILDAFLQPKHLLFVTIISVGFGLAFAIAENHGWIYRLMRLLRMTRKTGESDVWQQTFYQYFDRWISLEFTDGRRLVGWPRLFSSSGKSRALLLADATWYVTDGDGALTAQDVEGPGVYVERFDDIETMEVLN